MNSILKIFSNRGGNGNFMKLINRLVPLLLAALVISSTTLRVYDIIFFIDKNGLYAEKSAFSLLLAALVLVTAALALCFGAFVLPKREPGTPRKKRRTSLLSFCFIATGGLILLCSVLSFLGTDISQLRNKSVIFTLFASFFGILSGSFFIYSGIQLKLFSRFPSAVYAPAFSVLWALFRIISDFTFSPPLAAMSTRSYRTIVLAAMCIFLFFFAKTLAGIDESKYSKALCAFGMLFSALSTVVLLPDIYFYISIKDITSVLFASTDLLLSALALSFIAYRRYRKI